MDFEHQVAIRHVTVFRKTVENRGAKSVVRSEGLTGAKEPGLSVGLYQRIGGNHQELNCV